jgi:hypothetical protein
MAFELIEISADDLPMVKEKFMAHFHSYAGQWVIDPESSDCLLFTGRDYLDPTVPSHFVLLNKDRKVSYLFEVLAMQYARRHVEGWLSYEHAAPDFVLVLKLAEDCLANADIIKTKICDAMRALERNADLQFLFIPHWGRFY